MTTPMTTRLADLLTTAVRERAVAISTLRESQHQVDTLQAQLRAARLDLAVARELLAYHGLTPIEKAS